MWLRPGLHVKRWLMLLVLGMLLLLVGAEIVLLEVLDASAITVFRSLGMVRDVLAFVGVVAGPLLIGIAIVGLNHALLSPFRAGASTSLVQDLEAYHARRGGPKIVAIGGGTGLSTLLRGLKEHTDNIVAIVTVADDGGSSGRLRKELGVLPPGDFRQCIAALAEDEALTTSLFQYRFSEGESLKGHAFGNLFIAAMAGVTGNFETALAESGKVLQIRGRILPSTLSDVTLVAELRGERELQRTVGESEIGHSSLPIERVALEPDDAPAFPEAVRAILDADLVIAGPGSLYTSVMPNLLVQGIAQALRHSRAPKMYVANVATQLGETVGYGIHDHVAAIERHVGRGVFEAILVNDNLTPRLPDGYTIRMLSPEGDGNGYRMVRADVVDAQRPWRHDARKLGKAIASYIESRRAARAAPASEGEPLALPATRVSK